MMEALLDEIIRLYHTIARKEWETKENIVQNEAMKKELLLREMS